MTYEALDARTPIALLPTRIETRYFGAGDTLELRVRIYPDAIHVAPPRTGVAPEERTLVEAYWRAKLASAETAQPAHERLVQLAGEARARWLIRIAKPTETNGTLVFPALPPATDGEAPTVAAALPDRFCVLGFAGAARQFETFGNPVPASLVVSPLGAHDPRSRWQADFGAAEQSGVGIRVPIARAAAAALTRIVVVGVREAATPADSAAQLADLLERHADHRGASLLAVGTPTNHAPGSRPGGAPPPAPESVPAGSDGARIATAFGVPASAFAGVRGAELRTDDGARLMNQVTWPATWGYFFDHVLAPTVSRAASDVMRGLFVGAVRARGPYPTLLVDRDPYGILPASSLAAWRRADGADEQAATILRALVPRWLAAGSRAPRLPGAADPHAALVDIHEGDPVSVRWTTRTAASIELAGPWWLDDLIEIPAQLRQVITAELARVGLAGTAAVAKWVFADASQDLDLALVGGRRFHALHGFTGPSVYINAIAAAAVEALRKHEVDGANPRTLLYYLLRAATLLVMRDTSDDMVGTAVAARVVDDGVRDAPSARFVERLGQRVASFGNESVAAILSRAELPDIAIFNPLRTHRRALRALAAIPPAELQRLTAETIDLCSHRLDAWITGLATRRLNELRRDVQGVHLGAYGWIDAPAVPAAPARDEAAPTPSPGSRGHVLAPSIDHARTASVLRAGFLATPGSDLAIDLSSRRVRAARWLLDGMRAGRSLATLLGIRIERLLVEAKLGHLIPVLRTQHGLVRSANGEGTRPELDGLAAHDAWDAQLPGGELKPVAEEIVDLVDAVSDLLLAEAVHQHVVGNPARANATLDAVESGTTQPPDPDVTRTPLAGDSLAWSVMLSLGDDGAAWPGHARRARAVAHPALERWLASLFGTPAGNNALLRFRDRDAPVEHLLAFTDLELCAVDVVALATDAFAGSGLERLFARRAPASATNVEVIPSAALRRTWLLANAARRMLATATTPEGGSDPELAARVAQAIACIDRDRTEDSTDATSRLAAVVGASADHDAARVLQERLAADPPAAAIKLLTGIAPEREIAWPYPATDALATATDRNAWLADLARVRPVLDGLEIVEHAARASFELAAFAVRADLRAVLAGAKPRQGKVRALVLDAWVETTPRAETTAAVAFHHDAPSSRAPQAILLAVPPDPKAGWNLDRVVATLQETADLARVRLARPRDVWGPILPAIYFADALDDDTVSTPLGNDVAVLEHD